MKRQNSPDSQSFWDYWAGQYDPFMRGSEPLYDRVAQRMKQRLNRDMYALELACGTGMISQRIVGSVRSLEATDFSTEMIAQAKSTTHPPGCTILWRMRPGSPTRPIPSTRW